jgi:hypothetical protein
MRLSTKKKPEGKSSPKSVLAKQRPRRHVTWRRYSSRLAFGIMATGVLTLFFHWPESNPPLILPLQVHFIDDEERLGSQVKSKISLAVNHWLRQQPRIDLHTVVIKLRQHFKLANVTVIRTDSHNLVIRTQKLRPSFVLQLDSAYYSVTDLGAIFSKRGTPSDTLLESLPIVSGIGNSSDLLAHADGTLSLRTERQKQLLQQIKEILSIASPLNLRITTIHYNDPLGFILTDERATKIHIGQAPFQSRLNRLAEVLTRMATTGVLPERIELDYNGKVFVKEKKI